MVKLLHAIAVVFSLMFVGTCYGQGTFPFYANTGAIDCLYQQNGEDQCPVGVTELCSTVCMRRNPISELWDCVNGLPPVHIQTVAYQYGNEDKRVPKWTFPPCETNVGRQATTNPSYVCRRDFSCRCVIDPIELWYDCVSTPISDVILLNVSRSELPCVIICDKEIHP
jgi:hypothetical protein